MTLGLTNRQAQVLEFIKDFLAAHGYPPTVREVAAHFGFKSPRAAHDHMKALQRKGYIRSAPKQPRALEVLHPAAAQGIPVLGRIAAGEPILAVAEAEEVLDLDPSFFGAGEFFALKVQGDSMIEDHISEGDLVILRSQQEAQQGQVVAVLWGEEVTLKRFHRQGDTVELRPANQAMEPIRVRPDDEPLNILGTMVGLVRKV